MELELLQHAARRFVTAIEVDPEELVIVDLAGDVGQLLDGLLGLTGTEQPRDNGRGGAVGTAGGLAWSWIGQDRIVRASTSRRRNSQP
jgi:hypothetical protein